LFHHAPQFSQTRMTAAFEKFVEALDHLNQVEWESMESSRSSGLMACVSRS
jgi:hypothetical protein